ncbi:MAG: septum formation initiator family protein [Lachnospiraceae bacterium]|nr:septum formation initiator family protein [Lachnospiraceae bacterium]
MSRYRRNKNKSTGRLSIVCIVVILLAVMSIQIARLHEKNQEYIAREQELIEQLEEETERRDEIAEYEEYVGSQEYVEDTAKSKLGLVYENEIIFKEE